MSERNTGFYWVLFGGNEQIAYWHSTSSRWYVFGVSEYLDDCEVYVLDERRTAAYERGDKVVQVTRDGKVVKQYIGRVPGSAEAGSDSDEA